MKELIKKKLNHIPDFIQTTNVIHYALWGKISAANELLYNLVTGPFYSKNAIEATVTKYNFLLDEILLNIEEVYYSKLVDYFDENIKFIVSILMQEEMYEGLANMRDFSSSLQLCIGKA